jgi:hypothetical protein
MTSVRTSGRSLCISHNIENIEPRNLKLQPYGSRDLQYPSFASGSGSNQHTTSRVDHHAGPIAWMALHDVPGYKRDGSDQICCFDKKYMLEMQHVMTNAESCSRFYDSTNDIACAMPYIRGAIQFSSVFKNM